MELKKISEKYLSRLGEAGKPYLAKLGDYGKPFLAKLGKSGRLWLLTLKDLNKKWPKDYREFNELLPIVLLVFVLPVIILLAPSSVLRIILGLPLVLFLPGYTLLAALYVRKDRLKNLDRLALSFAISIAVVPIIGLLLNYMPGGISLTSFFLLIAMFILVMSTVAWIRRGWLPEEERYTIRLRWPRLTFHGSITDRLLSVALAMAVVVVVGSLVYVIVVPKVQENYTEFYITGLEDKSAYPADLIAHREEKVLVTVVNREGRSLDYRIDVNINGIKKGQAGTLTLENGQKYEAEIGFIPDSVGAGQEVEFALYLDGEAEPYLEPLHLWVDVE